MAESLTIDPDRSRLYENIIEQKRRQLAATNGLYARHQSPKKVRNTLASTAEDPQMQLKFTAWDEDLSEISKLTEKHSKLIEKTPEPSIFKKSFFEEQNDGLSEIHGDDGAPRMPAFTLKPAEKPEDNLHEAIDKLLAGHERAKLTRVRPSGLPEPRSREPLKQFDYSRLSKSRQSSQTRAKQVQVQRKDANLSVRSKSRPCMKDKLNNKLAFLVKTYAENNDKESVSYSGLGKILCNLGILKYITVSDLEINELLIAKIKENPNLAKEETSLHSELWKYLSYYCFEGTDLVPAQLLKSVLQTMMSKTPDQQGIKDLKRSLDEYLFNIDWLSEQITEFNDYVEAEIEESNGLPLFKVFLKFEELKKKPEFKKSFTKVTFDSLKEPIVQINSGREKLKKDLDIKNKQLDRTDLMFEGYEFVFLPDRGRAAMRSSSRQEYENMIKRQSFGDLMQETQNDHFTTAYQKPMERVKVNESMMRDREEQEKENYNMNLV